MINKGRMYQCSVDYYCNANSPKQLLEDQNDVSIAAVTLQRFEHLRSQDKHINISLPNMSSKPPKEIKYPIPIYT